MTELKEPGFYEQRGYVRHTLILRPVYKEQIKSIAKLHKVTQGELVEALIDVMDIDKLANNLSQRRELAPSKSDLMKKLKGISQEKITEIMKILG